MHFLNKNVWISLKISLKFVPKGLINNIPPLVQIMAWRRPGDKRLSEPMMVSLLTLTCVTWPQWVNGKITLGACGYFIRFFLSASQYHVFYMYLCLSLNKIYILILSYLMQIWPASNAANGLVPYGCQAICNHNTDLIVNIMSHEAYHVPCIFHWKLFFQRNAI